MDMSKLALFNLITRKMDWSTQRQEALAQNIANADTPEYRPSDLKPFDFKTALADRLAMTPVRTNPVHLTGGGPASTGVEEKGKAYETSPDGNAVVLEEQMMKVAQNNTDYQLATNIYRKHVALLKTAIGRS